MNATFDYQPLTKLAKSLGAKDFPSPTSIFSALNKKEHNFFMQQMKDKNSATYKATQKGTKTHRVLETGEAHDAFGEKILEVYNNNIACDVDETWGKEMGLVSMVHRYKGKFDGIGVYKGQPTVWDYKKTNSRKTLSGMHKWFRQCAAYAIAHNEMYGTDIQQLSIFNIYGKEVDDIGANVVTVTLKDYADDFISDVGKYYRMQNYIRGNK